MLKPDKIESKIKKTLKAKGEYDPSFDFAISICARLYCLSVNSYDDIERLGVNITELTRENNEKTVSNPASRICLDAAKETKGYLVELCLTPKSAQASDDDEVNELIEDVERAGKDGE